MGASGFPYPHRHAEALGRLRVSFSAWSGHGRLDGWWWPYSRDLTREGAHLVDAFPNRLGHIDRVVYAPLDWDVVTDRLFTSHGRIKTGFLPSSHPGGVVLVRVAATRILRLRVMPDEETWSPPGRAAG